MSRQPPLPPGPPPRHYNDAYDSHSRGDRYHPGDRYEPPPPPSSMYQFGDDRGGDSYQPSRSDYDYDRRARSPPRGYDQDRSYRPAYDDRGPPGTSMAVNNSAHRQNENFSFRYDAPPGVDYRAADTYRPRSRSPPPRPRDGPFTHKPRHTARGGGYRGRGGPRLASDRAFLKTNREPTPELLSGMDEDAGNGVRYKAIEDLSDSDEAKMDISGSEAEDENGPEQPKQKQARTSAKAADGDSVPRWSNPDPYTVLPPPDESLHKKKDVVKLIRKARVAAETEHKSKNEDADFISFDFDDDEAENQPLGHGVDGAPTGPRGYGDSVKNVPTGPRTSNGHSGSMREHFDTKADLGNGAVPTGPRASNSHRNVRESLDKPTEDLNLQPRSWIPDSSLTNFPAKPTMNMGNSSKAPDIVSSQDYYATVSDPALGSRKRTINDVIKSPPRIHPPTFGVKKPAASGDITREWRVIDDEHPTPWISADHSNSAKMGIWLHKEIMDFYNFVKPRDFEQAVRDKVVDDLSSKTWRLFSKDAEIHPFGSFPAGLYLPTADMDLVCVSSRYLDGSHPIFHTKNHLFNFQKFVRGEKLALDNKIEVILGAKVPLVKYVDAITGLKIDISFENDTGLIANKTFQDWKVQFPAMPIIVSVIKHLLAMRGLNEPVNGGIGGFSVICLVVSLLQNMPQVQSGNMIPEHHLGEILMEFFDLYGNHFNIETTAISLNPPGYVSKALANVPYKQHVSQKKFCIIDPNRSSNDISGGASNSMTIREVFSECFYTLQARMAQLQYSSDRRGESILGAIIAGNYSSFRLQREHLAHIHERQIGSIHRSD